MILSARNAGWTQKVHPAEPSCLETHKIHPYTHLNPYKLPQLTCGLATTPTHTRCHHLPAFFHRSVTRELQLFRCHLHRQAAHLQGEVPPTFTEIRYCISYPFNMCKTMIRFLSVCVYDQQSFWTLCTYPHLPLVSPTVPPCCFLWRGDFQDCTGCIIAEPTVLLGHLLFEVT